MATDVFLDLLTPTAARAHSLRVGATSAEDKARKPNLSLTEKLTALRDAKQMRDTADRLEAAPQPPAPPQPPGPNPHHPDCVCGCNYDHADIDRIVSEMIAAGFVIFDHETQTYRRPHVRRWRFA